MSNNSATLRSFITFAVIVPLALYFGYLLSSPFESLNSTLDLMVVGTVMSVLAFPLLLRWHYPLMLLGWNFAAVVFFLPGSLPLYLLVIGLSLGISVLQRTVNKDSQFISVPQVTFPLLCMLVVIAVTAKMTGLGLRAFGGDIYGGKKYVFLVGGILGYFALTARRIPLERKNLYLGLFFLGGLSAFIGDLFPWLPHWTYFMYSFFTFNHYYFQTTGLEGDTRFSGAVDTALAVIFFMLARYGIRGIFLATKPWRWVIFILFFLYGLLGGFRTYVGLVGLTFIFLFYFERVYRTRLLPFFLAIGLLGGVALIPLASHLPYTFQRALAFLPLNISQQAQVDAEGSTQWRLKMWQGLLPQIHQYLLMGKGYVISPLDYNFVMGPEASVRTTFAEDVGLSLAEDYHSGPISVIIPFGIWGCIAFLWFLVAGFRVIYANYRYGDPALQTVNSFLIAAYVARSVYFFFIFGGLSGDMLYFCGFLGLSVALNGGVCRPVRDAALEAKSKAVRSFRSLSPAPASAFQRRTG